MKAVDFHADVMHSEMHCVEFLRSFGLFNEEFLRCSGRNGKGCGKRMTRSTKKSRRGLCTPVWKCNRKACRSSRSIRSTNSFFTYRDKNNRACGKLQIRDIVLLSYEWLTTTNTIDQIMKRTGIARQTIVYCLNMFRDVCTNVLNAEEKWICSSENPAQVVAECTVVGALEKEIRDQIVKCKQEKIWQTKTEMMMKILSQNGVNAKFLGVLLVLGLWVFMEDRKM